MKVKRSLGFTLVEIMIVVTIVGLLAVIAIPAFQNARLTSQKNICIEYLRQIDGGKDQYALANNGAAPSMEDLVPSVFKKIPTCPTGASYTIGALGESPTCPHSSLGHTI